MRWRAVLAGAVLVLGGTARGDDNGAARVDYEEGTRRYALAEYGEALEAFKHAYMKYPSPAFLFNIAQCHRQLGHRRDAVRFYRNYLELSPAATDRADVEAIVAELEREGVTAAAAAESRPAAKAEASRVAPPVPAAAVAAPPSRPLVRRPAFWGALAGTLVVVAGGAVVVGVVAGTAERDPTPTRGTVQW